MVALSLCCSRWSWRAGRGPRRRRPEPAGAGPAALQHARVRCGRAAAEEARKAPERADSADLIAARALPRAFPRERAPDDLVHARERLRRIEPERLADARTARVRDRPRAKRSTSIRRPAQRPRSSTRSCCRTMRSLLDGRERVLDWWASALDEDARPRTEFERQALYQAVRGRMRDELAPASRQRDCGLLADCRGARPGRPPGRVGRGAGRLGPGAARGRSRGGAARRHRPPRSARDHPRARARHRSAC